MAGENENAGADDGADTERDNVDGGETALERHAVMRGQLLHVRIGHFGLQYGNRFADEELGHNQR